MPDSGLAAEDVQRLPHNIGKEPRSVCVRVLNGLRNYNARGRDVMDMRRMPTRIDRFDGIPSRFLEPLKP